MSAINTFQRGALALIVTLSACLALSACGDDGANQTPNECGAGTTLVGGECVADAMCAAGTTLVGGQCVSDSTCGAGTMLSSGMCVPTSAVTTYRQVEHLARPGIAEALIITPGYLAGYNATAPSFAGASAADVAAITAEVKTVLKAVYLGACLLNGLVGFTAVNGVHPGGLQCIEVGGNIFTNNDPLTGTVLDTGVATGAQAYADRVFSQFETDVMRIDTGVVSAYFTLCNNAAPANAPLLCGGRTLNDDTIDITYFYLLAGGAVPTGATTAATVAQSVALVTDGVMFSGNNSENPGIGLGLPLPDLTNRNQFHQSCPNCGTPVISSTFPYSARPH